MICRCVQSLTFCSYSYSKASPHDAANAGFWILNAKTERRSTTAAATLGGTCFLMAWTRGSASVRYRARNVAKKGPPNRASFSSRRFVQSQSQHAQGSVPFSCRQFRRECASLTDNGSKYSSQYGRSSARGGSQKHVSTQCASPCASTRAISISYRYSSPAIDPQPSVPSAIAFASASAHPDFT